MSFIRQVVPVTFYNFKKMITHFSLLDNSRIPHFKSSIFYVSYAINIINVFHNVNLALSGSPAFTSSKHGNKWKLSQDLRVERK